MSSNVFKQITKKHKLVFMRPKRNYMKFKSRSLCVGCQIFCTLQQIIVFPTKE